MKIFRRSILVALAAASLAPAQSGTAEVRKAEEEWVAAVSRADAASVDRMLADDLIYTHSTGSVDTKAQYLAKLMSGAQKYKTLQYSDQKIRTYGNTAVMNGTIRMVGTAKGEPFDNTLYVIHVWVKQGNTWKLVAHQTTKKAAS